MRTLVFAAVATAATWFAVPLLALPVVSAGAQGQGLSCDDFPFQAPAQAHLRANPGEAGRLDADGDGIACEDSPGVFRK